MNRPDDDRRSPADPPLAPAGEPQLTPGEEAEVAALLAEHRASGRVPDDVAARLDAVLADLAGDRAADRAADRALGGRRPGTRLLLAAAAVVVAGVGVTTVLPRGLGGAGDSQDAGTTADEGSEAASEGAGQQAEPDSATGGDTVDRSAARLDQADALAAYQGPADGLVVRERRLAADLEDAYELLSGARDGSAVPRQARSCVPPRLREGDTWTLVRYAAVPGEPGEPAALVAGPAAAGAVRLVLWSCDGARITASRLPAG